MNLELRVVTLGEIASYDDRVGYGVRSPEFLYAGEELRKTKSCPLMRPDLQKSRRGSADRAQPDR